MATAERLARTIVMKFRSFRTLEAISRRVLMTGASAHGNGNFCSSATTKLTARMAAPTAAPAVPPGTLENTRKPIVAGDLAKA